MSLLLLALLLIGVTAEPAFDAEGAIAGVVLNGSHERAPVGDTEVQLRAGTAGVFEPIANTRTDANGRFSFDNVPLDPTIVFLPGANRDGIHYPGQRVQLDRRRREASTTIVVFDAVHTPSPLTAARHAIEIQADERLMTVTETLVVSNPSRSTYVGQAQGDRGTVTLRLTIPENFDKVTFHREFFGRRFRIIDHRLVTDIPWPPGERELKFTYRVPLESGAGHFRRPLDLPTSDARVQVLAKPGGSIACELPRVSFTADEVVFSSLGRHLPAGHMIALQIGALPFAWMRYARWGALALLTVAIAVTFAVHRRRVRGCKAPNDAPRRRGKQNMRLPDRSPRAA